MQCANIHKNESSKTILLDIFNIICYHKLGRYEKVLPEDEALGSVLGRFKQDKVSNAMHWLS